MNAQGMLSCDAGHFGETEGGGRRWLVGDYEAGDAVFHHARESSTPFRRLTLSLSVSFFHDR